jgi:hypothetical protein
LFHFSSTSRAIVGGSGTGQNDRRRLIVGAAFILNAVALQQSSPRVIPENLRIPDIAPQRVHAFAARLIGHLENRHASSCSAGQEA